MQIYLLLTMRQPAFCCCFAVVSQSALFGKPVLLTFISFTRSWVWFLIFLWKWLDCLLLLTYYLFKNINYWEKQRENWDNLIPWHESWTSCLWRMLVLLWIVALLVHSILDSSHWDFWSYSVWWWWWSIKKKEEREQK